MNGLEIVMLVGFATGAALHLYITWLIFRREDVWGPEPSFVVLGLTLGIWHVGSLAAALFRALSVSPGGVPLRIADTVVFTSLAFLPAALAGAHVSFLGWRDDYTMISPRAVRLLIVFGYTPLVGLPFALARLWGPVYTNPVDAMGGWLALFSIWHVAVLLQSACVDLYLKRYFTDVRERAFFDRLAMSLVAIAVLYVIVFPLGMRSLPGLGRWLETLCQLASIVPTTIVAYYIFRYNLYKLVIQQSLLYALLVGLVMIVYLYGIRTFDQFLVATYGLRPGVIEAIGVAVIVLIVWPARRALDAGVRQLFDTEIGHYRELVDQVSTESHSFNELRALLPYIASIVQRALGVDSVRIILGPDDSPDTTVEGRAIAAMWQSMARDDVAVLQDDPLVWTLGVHSAWALRRDDDLVGIMLITSSGEALDAKKEAVLGVLAAQVAIAIENCKLVEDKVRLERELMNRERLAALGQMAATVAHEVKNPLSAIKSIVQVMREEERDGPRSQDLRLIVGEVDRLSGTVTQLLAFSRPAVGEARSVSLEEVVTSVSRLLEADAAVAGVRLASNLEGARDVTGTVASALREILVNLGLNAIQATPVGGDVAMTVHANGRAIRVEVTDSGAGIPESIRVKIREPFFTTRQRGTGLGLAIVERRVAELKGHLDIDSPIAESGGTRVTAVLQAD